MNEMVTTTHLVMNSPAELRPRLPADQEVEIALVTPPSPQLNHSLFMEIGTPFRWCSRLAWEYVDWDRHVNDRSVETWIGLKSGVLFGYFELQHRPATAEITFIRNACTEIIFFGLYMSRSGRGLGAHLLTRAIRSAWEFPGTAQVYVHTCTLDHPAALANYTSRGFSVAQIDTENENIPDPDDPIWSSPRYYQSLRRE